MSNEVVYVDFRHKKKLAKPTPLYVYPTTGKVTAPPSIEEDYNNALNRIDTALSRINAIIATIKGLEQGKDDDIS